MWCKVWAHKVSLVLTSWPHTSQHNFLLRWTHTCCFILYHEEAVVKHHLHVKRHNAWQAELWTTRSWWVTKVPSHFSYSKEHVWGCCSLICKSSLRAEEKVLSQILQSGFKWGLLILTSSGSWIRLSKSLSSVELSLAFLTEAASCSDNLGLSDTLRHPTTLDRSDSSSGKSSRVPTVSLEVSQSPCSFHLQRIAPSTPHMSMQSCSSKPASLVLQRANSSTTVTCILRATDTAHNSRPSTGWLYLKAACWCSQLPSWMDHQAWATWCVLRYNSN